MTEPRDEPLDANLRFLGGKEAFFILEKVDELIVVVGMTDGFTDVLSSGTLMSSAAGSSDDDLLRSMGCSSWEEAQVSGTGDEDLGYIMVGTLTAGR